MKKPQLLAALGALICLISCQGAKGDGSPSEVVRDFYKAAHAGDLDRAAGYFALRETLQEADVRRLAGRIRQVEIIREERGTDYSADTAWVEVRVSLSLDPEEPDAPRAVAEERHRRIFLAKRDERWKIVKRLQYKSEAGLAPDSAGERNP